jgi:hypothetical protein
MEQREYHTSKKKPCKECPFNKNNVLGPTPAGLGNSPAEVYIGQSEGPFWLPCHMEKGYRGKETGFHDVGQCRGAAIYRANLGISQKMPAQMLRLDKNTEEVFSDHVEFLMFYNKWTKEQAQNYLEKYPPIVHLYREMHDRRVRLQAVKTTSI